MTKISYRILKTEDAENYRNMRLDCLMKFPDNFGSSFAEESQLKSLKLEEIINSHDEEGFVMGAFEDNHHLIGICGFIKQTRSKTRHRGDLVQLFVNPHYTGKGIGKQLMKETISKAFEEKEIEQITLGVVHSNDAAINLYRQLGFVEYGRLEKYFKSGNDYFTQLFFVLSRPDKI